MEIRKVEDYYDAVQKEFPELTKKQIDRILKYGFRSFYTHTLYGGDVLSMSPYFTMYCGKMFVDNLLFYRYRILKKTIKLRIKYKRAKIRWDGYYYFGLTEKDYQNYLAQKGKKSTRRRKFTFKKIFLFKILDECLLHHKYKHIFKIKYPAENGFKIYREEMISRSFEYIYKRGKDNKIKPISYE